MGESLFSLEFLERKREDRERERERERDRDEPNALPLWM